MPEEEPLPLVHSKVKYDPRASRQGTMFLVAAILVLLLVAILVVVFLAASSPLPESISFQVSATPMGAYSRAAVACDHGYCSTIGKFMLQRNGSAVDAAIAALLCNGVMNIHNLGIGGGAYFVIWDSKTRTSHAFDAYGAAPKSASEEIYIKNPYSLANGNFAITVPGLVAGLYEVHRRFGRLSWADLVQPTINLCERGFKIGPALKAGIDMVSQIANLTASPEMAGLVAFLTNTKTGKFYNINDTLKCPALANSLKLMVEEGPMTLYNGTLAKLLIQDFADLGVPITKEDLLDYKVDTTRQPFELALPDGLTIFTTRPSSSGAASAFILNILSGYNFKPVTSQDPLFYHRYLEATKFAIAQLLGFGDPAFLNETRLEQQLATLASLKFGQKVRGLINDDYIKPIKDYLVFGSSLPLHEEKQQPHSTSHVSVLDQEGNAVSVTATVNRYFGSFVMGSRTGLVFNNAMANFFLNTSSISPPFNFIKPGKRPLTTLSPMIFVNKSMTQPELAVRLVVGASGSSRILITVPYVALRTLWFGETVKQAIDAGRLQTFETSGDLNVLYHEQDFPKWVLDFLQGRGYKKQKPFANPRHSICQAIQRLKNGTILAMADYRKELGLTDGY